MGGVRGAPGWPEWWKWEVLLTLHVRERMSDRGFTESDLRSMLEDASACHASDEPGRWIIETKRGTRPWKVIVEPDPDARCLVVITAYPGKLPWDRRTSK